MCGRYVLKRKDLEAILARLGLRGLAEFQSRFNIPPTSKLPAIRAAAGSAREAVGLGWGLVPSWAKDATAGARHANARAESIADKPAFRDALRWRRCVLPLSGFYEWQTLGRAKQPWYFSFRDGAGPVFAGLWESWRGPDGGAIETCALITTTANEVVQTVHDRMPVLLNGSGIDMWLDRRVEDPARLTPLLRAYPAEQMVAWPVSPVVNGVRVDGPECIDRVEVPPPGADDAQFSLGL